MIATIIASMMDDVMRRMMEDDGHAQLPTDSSTWRLSHSHDLLPLPSDFIY
jgi:hypothetical protein